MTIIYYLLYRDTVSFCEMCYCRTCGNHGRTSKTYNFRSAFSSSITFRIASWDSSKSSAISFIFLPFFSFFSTIFRSISCSPSSLPSIFPSFLPSSQASALNAFFNCSVHSLFQLHFFCILPDSCCILCIFSQRLTCR